MKRNLIIALAMLLLPVTASADDAKKEVKVPFSKGTSTLAFGFGLGTGYNFYNYYGYGYGYGFALGGYTRLPSLLAYFDHGIIDNAGPGNIGVGGIVAWRSSTYRYSNGDKERMRNLIIGVRGTYHITLLAKKNNKFDPYGGVAGGLRLFRYSETYSTYTDGDVYPFVGIFVGAKYNFSRAFGVFSELGYDVALFKAGLNLNF